MKDDSGLSAAKKYSQDKMEAYDLGWNDYYVGNESKPPVEDYLFKHWLRGYKNAMIFDLGLDED